MNYAELTANINDELEYTFTDSQIKLFTQNTEKLVYNTLRLPTLRKGSSGSTSANNQYLSLPADFIWPESVAVKRPSGAHLNLIVKDFTFIREAYPNPSDTGLPKYYAFLDDGALLLGPTPDDNYPVEMFYGYFPESIVTAGNTWLGDNYGDVLLNGCMVEAARFNKAEPDIIENYGRMFTVSLETTKNTLNNKQQTDIYRSGI